MNTAYPFQADGCNRRGYELRGRLSQEPLRLAIIAGEVSGDVLGAGLLRAFSARYGPVEAEGIGGARMLDVGCRSLYPLERLSVMGLTEVVTRYPEIMALRARLARRFIADPPDVFVGIDAPDFNLPLEWKLHRAGIPTVHYVSPQVWAWRRYRLRRIARSVDLMLTLFPFEADFYSAHHIPVEFVGHPLAQSIPVVVDQQSARETLSIAHHSDVVAILPGSRAQEVRHLARPMVQTARWLSERRPGIGFVVPLANDLTRAHFEAILGREGGGLQMRLIDGNAQLAMAASDVVLTTSGTATLEALLLKRPMVITYRAAALTYAIVKAMVRNRVRFIGLPNLLAGHQLVPELLQHEADPIRLGTAVLELLQEPKKQAVLRKAFEKIHRLLRRDADNRAAEAIGRLLRLDGRLVAAGSGYQNEKPASS